jgi:tRNA modification GTPase
VEKEGIRRTKGIIEASQIILYVVDGTRGLTPEDEQELEAWQDQRGLIQIWNKVDQSTREVPRCFLPLSAETGQGLTQLEDKIKLLIFGGQASVPGDVMIDSLRQKVLLDRSLNALEAVEAGIRNGISLDMVALDLKEAMDSLGKSPER